MKKQKEMKWYGAVCLCFLGFLCLCLFFSFPVKAEGFRFDSDKDGELIVVLDPGHGGENLGADYNGYIEKEINMVVANAMYDELSKYEGITVYLTHTEDVDMSLKERAQFAKNVNADFLFCLHFNMSANNNFYGTEVWVQSAGQENRDGYAFASVQLETMADMGLFVRGAKTRLNDRGTDYYGILRHCKEYGIAAALIEHCHIDNDADTAFCDSREDLEAFGRADATSVAKYFGLSSQELGVDYSDYKIPAKIEANREYLPHDVTPPDVSVLYLEECDYANYRVSLKVEGSDPDTPMLYYAYSMDGGETFSPCSPWPGADIMAGVSPDSFSFSVSVEPGTTPKIVVRVYNQYDCYTDSNILTGFSAFPEKVKDTETITEPETTAGPEKFPQNTEVFEEAQPGESGTSASFQKEDFPAVVEITLGIVAVLLLISIFIKPGNKKRR